LNPAAANPALAVRELCVTLRTGGEDVAVVDHVSFDLAPGEIVGLVGESGCGKSMTGAALMGMVPAPSAHCKASGLHLDGQDLAALDEPGWRQIRGSRIAMIFQEPLSALDPVFSLGSQLVEVIRRHQHKGRKAAREVALELVCSVGLSDGERILRSYPHELSGGMRQRVMIAMAMSSSPRLLIADEPTSALDVTTQAQILQQIRAMARESGTAVLLITHDLGVVAQVCDRAMVMYCGRLVEEGTVQDLFSSPRHPYTAGLLAALPRLTDGEVVPVQAIPGSVPRPGALSPGCHFNNRCARASQRCRVQVPILGLAGPVAAPIQGQRRHACHHPLEAGVP
jgi:oligopeptide/dipeptide ABC transporter ATP-binding protein